MGNFFTRPRLLREMNMQGMTGTGTVRANRTEKTPLKVVEEMKKVLRGSHDVAVDAKSNVTLVQWKDNKVAFGQQPLRNTERYIKDKSVDFDRPNSTAEYKKTMGGVDRMDQNISYYIISIHKKKWRWPLFCFRIDLAVNNAYQLYCIQPLRPGQKVLVLLEFKSELVNVYYARNRFLRKTVEIFPARRKQEKQTRCGNSSEASDYYCKEFNIGLNPECFKD